MYWKTKWFSTSLGCTILLITQCAINSLPLGRSVTQWKLCSSWRPILDCALWVFLAGFFHCKILLQTSILRVKTPNRAWGAVLNVRGPVATYIEVWAGGGGKEQIWLLSLCGCLGLSDYWTFPESLLSRVMFINFKLLKSTFLLLRMIAHAGSTTRSLQIMISLWHYTVVSCNAFINFCPVCHWNASYTTSSADIISFKKP